jgi:hypothetical protein
MKCQIALAAAALAATGLPGLARADDGLTYQDLVHCAASDVVVASILSADGGAKRNKTDIELARKQASALMLIAQQGSKKATEVVQVDVTRESDVVMAGLNDKTKEHAFYASDVPNCSNLGDAAIAVVNKSKTG